MTLKDNKIIPSLKSLLLEIIQSSQFLIDFIKDQRLLNDQEKLNNKIKQ